MHRVSTALAVSLALSAAPSFADEKAADGDGGARRSVFKAPGALLDRSEHTRPMEVSASVGLPLHMMWWGFGFGLGGRFYYPIMADGFIPALNDEFGIEGGLDLKFAFGGVVVPGLEIPVAARWGFHLTDAWTVFAKLGIGLDLRFWPEPYSSLNSTANLLVESSIGAQWKATDSLTLRFDLGYPWAKVGLVFAL